MAVIHPYYLNAYRIRGWGRLPFLRGATLAISNHQHDLDTTGVIMRLSVQGPWYRPIYAVASRRLFEPGFMGVRLKWLQPLVQSMNWGWMFRALGMLPLENEPRRRPVAAIAFAVYLRHGDLPLSDVFGPGVLAAAKLSENGGTLRSIFGGKLYLPARDTYVSLAAVREPFRSELVSHMRALIEEDFTRIESALRGGGTLYLTPEGRYTKDGKLGRFRMAIDRLASLASIYVLPVSYDPFAGRKLSLLYRVLPAQDPADLRSSLVAPRPVVVSQLLATWLIGGPVTFSESDAIAAVRKKLTEVPAAAFVDPELADDPDRMTRLALATMTQFGILSREGDSYRLALKRQHPQFPEVQDIVAHQANVFAETVAGLEKLAAG